MGIPQIKEKILLWGSRNRPFTRTNSGIYKLENEGRSICVHETGNYSTTATAANHALWLYNNPEMLTGYHFTVDDKEIWQHIPVWEGAWHAGDGVNGVGNRHSVGIEICVNMVRSDYGKYLRALDNGAWLCAKLIKERISLTYPDSVKQHYDFTGKDCPRIMRRDRLWTDFMETISDHLHFEEQPWPSYPIPAVQRGIGIEVDGSRTDEIGYLINNATYVRAAFVGDLYGAVTEGHGDHIKIKTK